MIAQELWYDHYQILLINLAEGIHKIKCKMSIIIKRYKMWGIKYKDFNCFLEYTIFRDNLIEYKCLCCNKNYYKILFNTHKFSNHDINRFIVLLWKVVYLYESLHEKPYFRFSNDLERWSFQKNRIGI